MSAPALSIDEAYRRCLALARSHYENFPVASRWIPAELRGPVAAVYAFARAADDFADEAGPAPGERRRLLADWRRRLRACATDPENHPVFTALADTIRRHELPLDPFERLITAFEMDVDKNRHATFEELRRYCRHSADPVGELVLRLHGAWTPERGRLSDAICTALQLANFWQDVTVDAKKDRLYIPEEDLNARGLAVEEVFRGPATPALRELIGFQVDRTWALFREGRPLCDDAPPGLRRELRLVWLGGTEILRKIEGRKGDVWTARPALGVVDWLRLGGRLVFWRSVR